MKLKKTKKKLTSFKKTAFSKIADFFDLKNYNVHNLLITFITFMICIATILSFLGIMIALNSIFDKNESKLNYVVDDGVKYIEIEDGYIKEELVIETGSPLPEIKDYFNEGYNIANDYSISYFKGNKAIELSDFTYQINGVYYLKGVDTIDVVIKNGNEYETKLTINDETPPQVGLKSYTIVEGTELNLKSLVTSYYDNSLVNEYSIKFKDESITSTKDLKPGSNNIPILICDISDNCFEGIASLEVTEVKKEEDKAKSHNEINPNKGNGSSGSGGSGSSGGSGGTGSSGNSGGNGSSGGSGNSGGSGGSTNKNTGKGLDITYVPTPPFKVCTPETITQNDFDYVENYYGTTITTHYDSVEYKINSDCSKSIIKFSGAKTPVVKYNYNVNTKALDLLREARTYMNNQFYIKSKNNIISLVNSNRAKNNLAPLSESNVLNEIATIRAIELAYSNVWSHIRPNGKVWSTIWDEYSTEITYFYRAENLHKVYGTGSAEKAVEAWMNSQDHRVNILSDNYTKTGVGIYTFNGYTYRVQYFWGAKKSV